jgi:hypothetical protein
MSGTNFDQQEVGFAFTDEDYARRYAGGKASVAKADALPAAPPQAPSRPARPHGGGNSFMRSRRRRVAASKSA